MLKEIISFIFRGNLLSRIAIAIVLAVIMGVCFPNVSIHFRVLGDLFIHILKSIAPILILALIITAISGQKVYSQRRIYFIIVLYLISTFLAAFLSVVMSFTFPINLPLLLDNHDMPAESLQNVSEVVLALLIKMLDNPVKALYDGNYIGILFWAILIGLGVKSVSHNTQKFFQDMAEILSKIISVVIGFVPLGIFGILSSTLADQGIASLNEYLKVIVLLVSTMLIMMFIINPLLMYVLNRKNPYPLLWIVIRTCGVTAFFTRSSVANVPINLKVCEELKLDKNIYSVTIPLGATINMAGAAITITILTLAAAHTLQQPIYFITTLLLGFLASICAAGSSGVPGGSIMLIPVACNLFGISQEIAGMVMGVGFVIGIIQDSMETALNSSSDVILTAAGCRYFTPKTKTT